MKLFNDDKTEQNKASAINPETQHRVAIISSRKRILDDINSTLLMYDIDDTESIMQNFLSISDITITQGADVIVADIENCTDITKLQQSIALLVPVNTRCILLGDSDSIIFAREMNKLGASYLHLASQLPELPEFVLEQSNNTLMRGSIIFSVLGCKGGSGASSFCYDLLQTAGKASTIPLLMVQGAAGSLDLDLLLGRAIPKDGSILPFDKNISVKMEQKERPWNYEDQNFNRFNMIFIDNPVYNCSQERLDYILKYSHSLLLLITRDLSSLRIAKTVLDHISRSGLSGNTAHVPRVFICLNNYRPPIKNELTNSDIEEYLGQSIDVIRAYQQDPKKRNENVDDALRQFAAMLLGKKALHTESSPKSFFKSFFEKKVN
ncbi:hypothetical protein I2494_07345 [Budviciaceae bacterium BWR-B9]|uniref:Pilus assembly protein n=1 Tax=Limnobaculum allomyrinae TaxID=2791986 RepID=A0ABS1IP67_9GAMM|nr:MULTISPECIES: hypothetical protein [Limnobaculum]MBK5143533.1 hypothetical protein [Limnobaculum allomyrinae]MBV7691421.1 hypothetical protein [Limnobaculum sp. M2-1]